MGTTSFQTEYDAGRILMDELCSDGVRIRMFTISPGSACVVLRADLAVIEPRFAEMIRAVYDLPASASVALVALVAKHTGLDGAGGRSVSLKFMDETVGPYQCGGANRQLLSILSPLRAAEDVPDRYRLMNQWARDWRARAWSFVEEGQVWVA